MVATVACGEIASRSGPAHRKRVTLHKIMRVAHISGVVMRPEWQLGRFSCPIRHAKCPTPLCESSGPAMLTVSGPVPIPQTEPRLAEATKMLGPFPPGVPPEAARVGWSMGIGDRMDGSLPAGGIIVGVQCEAGGPQCGPQLQRT